MRINGFRLITNIKPVIRDKYESDLDPYHFSVTFWNGWQQKFSYNVLKSETYGNISFNPYRRRISYPDRNNFTHQLPWELDQDGSSNLWFGAEDRGLFFKIYNKDELKPVIHLYMLAEETIAQTGKKQVIWKKRGIYDLTVASFLKSQLTKFIKQKNDEFLIKRVKPW